MQQWVVIQQQDLEGPCCATLEWNCKWNASNGVKCAVESRFRLSDADRPQRTCRAKYDPLVVARSPVVCRGWPAQSEMLSDVMIWFHYILFLLTRQILGALKSDTHHLNLGDEYDCDQSQAVKGLLWM